MHSGNNVGTGQEVRDKSRTTDKHMDRNECFQFGGVRKKIQERMSGPNSIEC